LTLKAMQARVNRCVPLLQLGIYDEAVIEELETLVVEMEQVRMTLTSTAVCPLPRFTPTALLRLTSSSLRSRRSGARRATPAWSR